MISNVKLNSEADIIFKDIIHEYGDILLRDSIKKDELLPIQKLIQTIITSGIMMEHHSTSSRYTDLRKYLESTFDSEMKGTEEYKNFISLINLLQRDIAITQAGETGEKHVLNELNLLYPMPSKSLRNISFSDENECESDIIFLDSYGYVWNIEVKNPKSDSMVIEADGEYHPKHGFNKNKRIHQYLKGSLDAQKYHLTRILDEYYMKTGKILKLKTLLVCANPSVEIISYNDNIEVCGIRDLRSRIINEHNSRLTLDHDDLNQLAQLIQQHHMPQSYPLKDYLCMDVTSIILTYSKFAARIKLAHIDCSQTAQSSSYDERINNSTEDNSPNDTTWDKVVSFFSENQENIQTAMQIFEISITTINLIKLLRGTPSVIKNSPKASLTKSIRNAIPFLL